jgi:hypothetical protein
VFSSTARVTGWRLDLDLLGVADSERGALKPAGDGLN